jgi:hypothetical protein
MEGRNRPLIQVLTGNWISMAGTALVTLAGFFVAIPAAASYRRPRE